MRAAQPSTSAAWRVAAKTAGPRAARSPAGGVRRAAAPARPAARAPPAAGPLRRGATPRAARGADPGAAPRPALASARAVFPLQGSVLYSLSEHQCRVFLGMVVGARWRRLCAFAIAMLMLVQGPASPNAQTGANGPFLSAPTLPATLPGGVPLPTLPPAAQAEILQRILEGAGTGRAAAPPTPASLATPIPPLSPLAPAPPPPLRRPRLRRQPNRFPPPRPSSRRASPAPSRCASSTTKASPLPRGRRVRSDRASARCPTTI